MEILFGLLLIVGGIGYTWWYVNRTQNTITEIQYMKTSTIADAIALSEEMLTHDPEYHHYVELKGQLHSDSAITAPYTEQAVAYYRNKCLAVYEETIVERDANGNTRRRVVKKEREMASEESSAPVYITDSGSGQKVFVDIQSFVGDCDFQSGCDRFEPQGSAWGNRFQNSFHWSSYGNSRFLGYHLQEEVLYSNQPVYILGELYKNGDNYYIGRSVVGKKPSKFSYKSEDTLIQDMKSKKQASYLVGGLMALFGLALIVMKIL